MENCEPEFEKARTITGIRREFLNSILRGEKLSGTYYVDGKIHFLITRGWNSWYPSYINVKGGCYTFVTSRHQENDSPEKNPGVIVVDPGFGFLSILRELYGIEFRDIGTIVVSHFHPDHAAGLTEFLTLSFESKHQCEILLNETTFEFFKDYRGGSVNVRELREGQGFRLCSYENQGFMEEIFMTAKRAFHSEIGQRHRSLSLQFNVSRKAVSGYKTSSPDKSLEYDYNIGLLGDTDGNKIYTGSYLDFISEVSQKRNILILHLGSMDSRRCFCGYAHLYYDGLFNLLKEVDMSDKSSQIMNLPDAIVISEFGVELGHIGAIVEGLRPFCLTNNWRFFPYVAKLRETKATNSESLEKYNLYAKMMYLFIQSLPNTSEPTPEYSIQFCFAFPFLLPRAEILGFGKEIQRIKPQFKEKMSNKNKSNAYLPSFRVSLSQDPKDYEWMLDAVDSRLQSTIFAGLRDLFVQANLRKADFKETINKLSTCLFNWSIGYLSRTDVDIVYEREFSSVADFLTRTEVIHNAILSEYTCSLLLLESLFLSQIIKKIGSNLVQTPDENIIPLKTIYCTLVKNFPRFNIVMSDLYLNIRINEEGFQVPLSPVLNIPQQDLESGWNGANKISCKWIDEAIKYVEKE